MRLNAVSGPHAGWVVDIGVGLTIGRGPDRRLRLSDPSVSRRHATVWATRDGAYVRDDGSLNGTWVNDRSVAEPRPLRPGDRLRIGRSEFLVRDADADDGDRGVAEPAAAAPEADAGASRTVVTGVGEARP